MVPCCWRVTPPAEVEAAADPEAEPEVVPAAAFLTAAAAWFVGPPTPELEKRTTGLCAFTNGRVTLQLPVLSSPSYLAN